ncbi:MAG: sodium:proton antiporter [Bacteroidia bacterium]|nr:sodium:proton antiporter [Bacteroidia bacterium]
MKRVILFSFLLILGLVLSQLTPVFFGDNFETFKSFTDALLYITLGYIMINVGREFEINKTQWRSYTKDYVVAMITAALPWFLVALYYIIALPPNDAKLWQSSDAWKEILLLSRFAAPTSAGILFTMLVVAGLKQTWVYKKIQVLAIFDDLDTIILMIPLQIFMIGLKWQMFVILLVAIVLLILGWRKMGHYHMRQDWKSILLYSVIIFVIIQAVYLISTALYASEGSIHIEILLPAFVLGMIMKTKHNASIADEKMSLNISYLFMLLVGMSMPAFLGVDFDAIAQSTTSVISRIPMLPWGVIMYHVFVVTVLSNLGKLAPLFFYRKRRITERLAVSIGMFTRGEVGAGVIFIAIGYNIGGPMVVVSVLAMALNLVLTGFFVVFVRYLTKRAIVDSHKHL